MKRYFLGFDKQETLFVLLIFMFLLLAVGVNLRISLRKSRDAQRKADIRSIYDSLNKYQADFGFFPLSSDDGKILACAPYDQEKRTFSACEWGQDALRDIFDSSYTPYLQTLPLDPQHSQGAKYFYISNGRRYQIYASLESNFEDEFDESIVERNLSCGVRICNFGRAFGKTPLDKSIEEYENEIKNE